MGQLSRRLLVTSLAFSLPLTAWAAPPDATVEAPREAEVAPLPEPPGDAPPPLQKSGLSQDQGSDSQGQTLNPTPPPQGGNGQPTIQFQPQIQVQVQPQINVEAKPNASADSDANADADAQANPTSTATSTINAEVDQDVDAGADGGSAGGTAGGTPTMQQQTVVHMGTPGVPVPRQPHKKPKRRGKGLMLAGTVVFGVSYANSAFNGAYIYDRCDDRYADPVQCKKFAKNLWIPVAGPFMSLQHTNSAVTQVKLSALGGTQALGALMAVVGTVLFIRDGRRNRILNQHGVRVAKGTYVAPSTHTGGGGVALTHRF